MIVDKINKYLSSNQLGEKLNNLQIGQLAHLTFRRQFIEPEEEKARSLWFTHAGKCPRQIAYHYHGFPRKGKEIDSRSKIIFWQGDMAELMILELARLAGCNITATGLSQITLKIDIEGTEIRGRPDGLLLEGGQTYLVECKSMASHTYERFEKGVIDDNYIAQINMNLSAANLRESVIVAFNKDKGLLTERLVSKDEEVIRQSIDGFLQVIHSTPENLPPPKYQPDARGFYPWQCVYCAWWGHCIPEAERYLVNNRYMLRQKQTQKGGNHETSSKED
ncbi:MAG: hypothetical protein ACUVWN_04635 [bacterium]